MGAHLLDAAKLQLEDLIGDGVLSGRGNVGDITARAGGHHDPVIQQRILVHVRVDVAARQPVPHLRQFSRVSGSHLAGVYIYLVPKP